MDQVRTRFAPSPTGALHVGNVRVAIFNWLFARHHRGAFLLRIEDTDPERNLPGAEAAILEDLRWLGLHWDEGLDVGGPVGPYRQSERLPLYRPFAERLVREGKAYPCYCGPGETGGQGKDAERARYSGRCRALTEKERACFEAEGRVPSLRFRVPPGRIDIQDEVKGTISFPADEFGDFVILRGDGRPVYNFAVVVDDALMRITHVIRGVGHLSNTPKQALLFDALGVPRPRFAHLPTVLGADRRKLSKREGAAAVAELREAGYHPDAVVNYLSLLGWSSPGGEEFLMRERLIAEITLERVGTADTVFDPEKLRWLSARHMDAMPLDALVEALHPWADRMHFPLEREALATAVAAVRSHLHTFADIRHALAPLFPPPPALDAARSALARDPAALRVLHAVTTELAEAAPWTEEAISAALGRAGRKADVRGAQLFHPVRRAVTGAESGPELVKVLAAIGSEETLARLRKVGRKRV